MSSHYLRDFLIDLNALMILALVVKSNIVNNLNNPFVGGLAILFVSVILLLIERFLKKFLGNNVSGKTLTKQIGILGLVAFIVAWITAFI